MSEELLILLQDMRGYIREKEVLIDSVWGDCRTFDELLKADEVHDLYHRVREYGRYESSLEVGTYWLHDGGSVYLLAKDRDDAYSLVNIRTGTPYHYSSPSIYGAFGGHFATHFKQVSKEEVLC